MKGGAKIAQTILEIVILALKIVLRALRKLQPTTLVDHAIPRHRQRTEGMSFWTSLNAAVKNTFRNITTRRRNAFAALPLNRKRPRSLHRDLGFILSWR